MQLEEKIVTSDEIETAALRSLHAAADAALRDRLGLDWRPVGAGAASIAAALPASAIVVNRALGLAGPNDLRQTVAAYRDAGAARFFINGAGQGDEAAFAAEAAALGLLPARGWRKFARGRAEPVPAPPAPFPFRELAAGQGADFGWIVAAAFDLGDAAADWLALLPGAPGWRVFAAFDGDRPVGTGALFVEGDTAWTDWGATAPSARGRGVQFSLLAHRVQTALDMGVRDLFTCTGEAVPGEPQHSYANILRCGFAEGVLRPNFAPPKA
jgi:GNAT superfamily N-acetyltransferase